MADVKTNAGRAIATNLISGLGGAPPTYLAIGSGATPAAATDTQLGTEFTAGTWSGYARVHVTPTRITGSVSLDTISWTAAFTAPAAVTVSELGLFDAASGGNLYMHSVFTGIPLQNGDQISFTVTERQA